MARQKIIITNRDHQRLEQLLASEFAEAIESKSYLTDLETELRRARIVDSTKIPIGVVTMGSTVRLRDLDTDEVDLYTLVYPHEANIAESKLSILAPIGTAILGYGVGDVVRWRMPSGQRRLQIEEVRHQSEREKVFQ